MLFNDSSGESRFNLSGRLRVQARQALVSQTIRVKSNQALKEFDTVLFQVQFDSCKVSQGMFGNIMVEMLVTLTRNFSNIQFKCPIQTGRYYLTNFPTPDDAMMPPFFLKAFEVPWELTVNIRIKLARLKSATQLLTIKLYGIRVG